MNAGVQVHPNHSLRARLSLRCTLRSNQLGQLAVRMPRERSEAGTGDEDATAQCDGGGAVAGYSMKSDSSISKVLAATMRRQLVRYAELSPAG